MALQKLMVDLGQLGKDINNDIGNLVKNGLPVILQQTLDIVRFIGNVSVHPGKLDMKDDLRQHDLIIVYDPDIIVPLLISDITVYRKVYRVYRVYWASRFHSCLYLGGSFFFERSLSSNCFCSLDRQYISFIFTTLFF
ncbi:DUF4145 domain-containing protein [Bacillus sp. ISL-39]|uniref:DUF4145 domain-containing protein n=1 Tax=Bacillus sp. ISL-39 TaxID=2819124 RepID=UPI00333BB8A0